MRRLSFDTGFSAAPADAARLVVSLSMRNVDRSVRDSYLGAMTDSIPFRTLRPALAWFHAMEGLADATLPHLDGTDIVIPLSAAATAPWQVAILLNLADFAVADADPDARLITAVQVHAPNAGRWTFDGVLDDLQRRMDVARDALTARLPPNTFIDEYTFGTWPPDADRYTFDITWKLDQPLAAESAEGMQTLLEDLDLVVGWMGFALDGDAPGWEEAGRMIFPGDAQVGPNSLVWAAERPPSDIAFACHWIDRAIERHLVRETIRWTADIRPLDG